MARLSPQGIWREFDNNGDPLSGGLLYTYEAGTTTPKTTYTSESEGTANPNPVILDSNGRAKVWLESGAYKFILKDSNDVEIWSEDDIVGESSNAYASTIPTISTNTNINSIYNNNALICNAAVTLSLADAETLGDGYFFSLLAQNGDVILEPDGSQLINNQNTLTIRSGYSATVLCDGVEWYTLFNDPYDKKKTVSTVDPTINDDITAGYEPFSRWINSVSGKIYTLVDATEGAAVWELGNLEIEDLGSMAVENAADYSTTTEMNTAIQTALEPIDERTITTGTSNVDFTGLEAGKSYRFIFEGLKGSAASNNALTTLLSTNNGTSFISATDAYRNTGYGTVTGLNANDTIGRVSGLINIGNDSSTFMGGEILLIEPMRSGRTRIQSHISGNNNTEIYSWTSAIYRIAIESHNAIRFTTVTGTLEAGVIKMFEI